MTDQPSPLEELARLLRGAAVDYALIGGHAVNVWLEPRFTADIDITLAAGGDDLNRLRGVLARAGYTTAVEHGADFPSGPDFIRGGLRAVTWSRPSSPRRLCRPS